MLSRIGTPMCLKDSEHRMSQPSRGCDLSNGSLHLNLFDRSSDISFSCLHLLFYEKPLCSEIRARDFQQTPNLPSLLPHQSTTHFIDRSEYPFLFITSPCYFMRKKKTQAQLPSTKQCPSNSSPSNPPTSHPAYKSTSTPSKTHIPSPAGRGSPQSDSGGRRCSRARWRRNRDRTGSRPSISLQAEWWGL